MTKNLICYPILVQIWVPIIFFVDFTPTRRETLLQAITVRNFKKNGRSKLKKMAKKLILDLTKAHWAQIWAANFFFFFFSKIWQKSDTRYHGQLSSCTISISEKTDQKDGQEWFHMTLSDKHRASKKGNIFVFRSTVY